jgi:hypothetical protein
MPEQKNHSGLDHALHAIEFPIREAVIGRAMNQMEMLRRRWEEVSLPQQA